MTINTATEQPATPAQVWATRIAFLTLGVAMAAWAPLIPFVKTQLGVSDAFFGLLLLCIGVSAFIAMPWCGVLASKFGCRPVIVAGTLMMCLGLPIIVMAPSLAYVAPGLILFGVGIAAVDIAMNIQAVVIEQRASRAIMSGLHGCYSLGGMLGAGFVSGVLWLTNAPVLSLLLALGLVLLASASTFRYLLSEPSARESTRFVIPRGLVLLIGIMCFVVFMAEGAILDWSALFLRDYRDADLAQAGLGYVFFSLAMVVGRFTGDALVTRLGGMRVLFWGGLIAAGGFTLVVNMQQLWLGYVGFALVGIGCANIVPVLFTATGKQTLMPVNAAITAVAGIGYLGGLLGPALIGFISHVSSLSIAFLVVSSGLFVVACLGKGLFSKHE
jgi:fucose permease